MSKFSFTDGMLYALKLDSTNSFINNSNYKIDIKDFENFKSNTLDFISEEVKLNTFNKIIDSLDVEDFQKSFFGIQSAIINSKIWEYNELHVKFIDGNQTLQEKIMSYAREWENYCAVKFKVITEGNADITITFNDKGFWSYIGSESKDFYPSMSLTGIEKVDNDYFRGTVFHEFGHALGLIHEHQSPNSPIKWNETAVYDYYWDNHKWSTEKTFENVLKKYSFDQFNDLEATKFDPESIMIYYIPKEFLASTNQVEYKDNNEISDLDKKLINEKYY